MDFVFLDIWTAEAQKFLLNQRLNSLKKDRDKYILGFTPHSNLFFSLFSGDPLCFLTNTNLASGKTSSFTKTISQHLLKSTLIKIEIADKDKVIYFTFEKASGYSGKRHYLLICELIPRYENIILAFKNSDEKLQIIDSHKRVTFSQTRYRQIFPGIPYFPPPLIEKPYIFALSREEFMERVGEKLPETWQEFIRLFSQVPKFLSSRFAPETPTEEFWSIVSDVKQKITSLKTATATGGKNLFYDEKQECLSLIIETQAAVPFSTVNEAFIYYYEHKCVRLQLKQVKSQIIRGLEKKAEHLKEKIQTHENKLEKMKDAEKWKVYGELLKIHLGEIEKGQKEVRVKNYFVDQAPYVIIPLKPEWTPQENMQHYFKKYQKAKSGVKKLDAYISRIRVELKAVLEKIERVKEAASLEEINEFRDEFDEDKKKHGNSESLPFRNFSIQVGKAKWKILVGKTSRQNDELTIRFARPYDWFFHSRIYHGAHVVVQNPEKRENLPEQVIEAAASLAAYYSKAKHSTKVPVDYTQIRYVSKPRKAPPGMVVYKNHKTSFVNPVNLQAKDPAWGRTGTKVISV